MIALSQFFSEVGRHPTYFQVGTLIATQTKNLICFSIADVFSPIRVEACKQTVRATVQTIAKRGHGFYGTMEPGAHC